MKAFLPKCSFFFSYLEIIHSLFVLLYFLLSFLSMNEFDHLIWMVKSNCTVGSMGI